MKIKDFFRLAIKLIGLYSLVVMLLSILPQLLSLLFSFSSGEFSISLTIITILFIGGVIAYHLFIVFRSDWIIHKLKLDEKFDSDQVNLEHLNAKTLLSIGVILIGGLVLIENLAPFFQNSFYFVRSIVATSDDVRMESALNDRDQNRLILNSLNILVGYILLTNYAFITTFLLPKKESGEST